MDRRTLAEVLNNLGEILEKTGKSTESDTFFARSATIFEEKGLGGEEPRRLHALAYVLTNQGKLAQNRLDLEKAQGFFRLAIARDRDAAKLLASYKVAVLEDYDRLAALLIQKGDHQSASLLAFEMINALPETTAARVNAAGIFAKCVDLARSQKIGTESDRGLLAKAYATKGFVQLRIVLDSGYKKIEDLKANPSLKNLLKEPESRDFLPDLVTAALGSNL